MIYITGDTHGTEDWEKLSEGNFLEQEYMHPDIDFVIVTGDFGGVWGDEDDDYVLKFYNSRNFTTLFIDGNHENHDLLDKYPVEEWHGGKVHKISDSIIHLMRGQVFNLEGFTIFTMGGAESTDKQYRKEGESWWAREMPSDEEYKEAIENLRKVNFKVDVVLTHCAPEGYIGKEMNGFVDRSGNRLTRFLDSLIVDCGLEFKHWYFGHYHMNMDWENFSLVFSSVKLIVIS